MTEAITKLLTETDQIILTEGFGWDTVSGTLPNGHNIASTCDAGRGSTWLTELGWTCTKFPTRDENGSIVTIWEHKYTN